MSDLDDAVAKLYNLKCEREVRDMLKLIEAKPRPSVAFIQHDFFDVEAKYGRNALLAHWLRAVYRKTAEDYKRADKVAIINVPPKKHKNYLEILNAQIADQIGSGVELVVKKKK